MMVLMRGDVEFGANRDISAVMVTTVGGNRYFVALSVP